MVKYNKEKTGLRNMLIVILLGSISVILFSILFLDMCFGITNNPYILQLDKKILVLLISYRNPLITNVMKFITYTGNAKFYFIIMPIFIIFYVYKKQHLEISVLTISLLGGHYINQFLKNYFGRIRPTDYSIIIQEGFSFPSGHAMVSICFYGMLAYIITRNIKSKKRRIFLISTLIFYTLLIGFSRIYLGVHWPSDVIGGYIIGMAWLYACIIGIKRSSNKY